MSKGACCCRRAPGCSITAWWPGLTELEWKSAQSDCHRVLSVRVHHDATFPRVRRIARRKKLDLNRHRSHSFYRRSAVAPAFLRALRRGSLHAVDRGAKLAEHVRLSC